jgi:hypothetical protein
MTPAALCLSLCLAAGVCVTAHHPRHCLTRAVHACTHEKPVCQHPTTARCRQDCAAAITTDCTTTLRTGQRKLNGACVYHILRDCHTGRLVCAPSSPAGAFL